MTKIENAALPGGASHALLAVPFLPRSPGHYKLGARDVQP